MTGLTGPACDGGRCQQLLRAFAEAKERWRQAQAEQMAAVFGRALARVSSLSEEQRAEMRAAYLVEVEQMAGDEQRAVTA